jgi:hypothetical protein
MITLGRGMGRMGAYDSTVTVDPIVVNGQTTAESGSVITGDKPPFIPKTWWPWIITAGALGFAWWVSSTDGDDDEEGDVDDRPFDGE